VPRRVLLVEDDASTLDVLARLLRGDGFDVQTARCAEDGLRAGRDGDFDIVVTDISLPDRSGAEMMRELGALRHCPGIAMSGWKSDMLAPADVLVFAKYLVKPFDFTDLRQAIDLLTHFAERISDDN
jgi:DNA-binding response OmpR family regulator